MRLTPILAAAVLASSAVFFGVGCSATPLHVEHVDQSVLPVEAKALLSTDSQITNVYKETYAGGTVMYKINYNKDGESRAVRYNAKTETSPHGVFQDPIH